MRLAQREERKRRLPDRCSLVSRRDARTALNTAADASPVILRAFSFSRLEQPELRDARLSVQPILPQYSSTCRCIVLRM
jgi:hypothetical protein